MTDPQQVFDTIANHLTSNPGIVLAKMFGSPCLKINGNVFVTNSKNGMTFKLSGPAHAEALKVPGAALFDPSGMGRPMKEWVQIPAAQSSHWPHFADEALTYVSSLPAK